MNVIFPKGLNSIKHSHIDLFDRDVPNPLYNKSINTLVEWFGQQ